MRSFLVGLTTAAVLLVASSAAANVFTLVRTSPLGELSAGDTVTYDVTYVQNTDLISLGFSVRTTGVALIQTGMHGAGSWLDQTTFAFFSPVTAGFSVRTTDNIVGGWAWTSGAPPAFASAGLVDMNEPFNMMGSAGFLGTVTVKVDAVAADGTTFDVIPFLCNTDYSAANSVNCTDDEPALPGGVPIVDCSTLPGAGGAAECIDFDGSIVTEMLPEPSAGLLGAASLGVIGLLARRARRQR